MLGTIGLAAALATAAGAWYFLSPNQEDNGTCAQVLTDARDPSTGKIETFSTPCDVPEGWDRLETDHERFNKGTELWTRYRNDDLGIRFEYRIEPDGYLLVENNKSEVPQEDILKSLSLFNKKEYADALASNIPRELPPSISILIYNNPHGYTPLQWAGAERMVSGLDLIHSTATPIQFAGVSATRYTTDGLYTNDVIVALNNKLIYYISGSWITEDSPIRKDFLAMLQNFALY